MSQPFDPGAISPAEYLSAVVASSQDAIISKNLKGIVTSWNPAAEQIFGYTAEEMVGRPIAILAGPQVQTKMPEQILQRITRGERVEHYETLRRRKDGQSSTSPSRFHQCATRRARSLVRPKSHVTYPTGNATKLNDRNCWSVSGPGTRAAEHAMLMHQEAEREAGLIGGSIGRACSPL